MLSEAEIEEALNQRLNGQVSGYNIVWANTKGDGKTPYLDVAFFGGDRTGGALKGGQIERVSGGMSVTVVTEAHRGTSVANGIADEVASAFAEGTLIDISSGGQIIIRAPSIRKGFPARTESEAKEWRVPVIIPYEVTKL